jgi:hypothetical protein
VLVVHCDRLCNVCNHNTKQVSAEEAKAKKKAAKEAAKQAEDELKLLFNDALVAGKKAPGAAAGKGSNAAEPVAVEVKEKQVPYTTVKSLLLLLFNVTTVRSVTTGSVTARTACTIARTTTSASTAAGVQPLTSTTTTCTALLL